MPKTKLEIPAKRLQSEINDIEAAQTFTNRQQLFDAIAKTNWAASFQPKPLTVSVIASRFTEFNLTCKTPKGVKGRPKGYKREDAIKVPRIKRADKWAADPDAAHSIESVRLTTEPAYHHLVDKLAAGSARAAIGLKCIDCCGGVQSEVKRCELVACPLYNLRLWKESAADRRARKKKENKESLI